MVKNIIILLAVIPLLFSCKKDFGSESNLTANGVVEDVKITQVQCANYGKKAISFEYNGAMYYAESEDYNYTEFRVYKYNSSSESFSYYGVIDLDQSYDLRGVVSVNGSLVVISSKYCYVMTTSSDGWDFSKRYSVTGASSTYKSDIVTLCSTEDKFFFCDDEGYIYSGTPSGSSLTKNYIQGYVTNKITEANNKLYFANEYGVYESNDEGLTWTNKLYTSSRKHMDIAFNGTYFIVSYNASSYVYFTKYDLNFNYLGSINTYTSSYPYFPTSTSYDMFSSSYVINGYYLNYYSNFYDYYDSFNNELVVGSDDISQNSPTYLKNSLNSAGIYPCQIGNKIYSFNESTNRIQILEIKGF